MSAGAYLTFDIDWAPEFAIDDLTELLTATRVPVTVFHTHRTGAAERLLKRPNTETAVHPNFLDAPDPAVRLKEVLTAFPAAKGVRNHRLYYHSGLLGVFHKAGIEYLSNDLLFLQEALQPLYDWSGLVRLPIYWEDDVQSIYFGDRYDLAVLNLARKGMKVFNFHPIHLFLNTRDVREYRAVKSQLKEERDARKHQKSGRGIRTLFLELLREIEKSGTKTLGEAARDFRRAKKYEGHYAEYG